MEVRFTASGLAQLLDVIGYLRRNNLGAAVRFRQQVEAAMRRLEQFPDSGRRIPEFPELSYREIVVGPYRFFYLAVPPVIWIVGVWHGAQLPTLPEQ